MWRWSKAATSLIALLSSMPLPNTSPDMSPQPIARIGSLCTSIPTSRKWRWTETQAPRAVIPIALWQQPGLRPQGDGDPGAAARDPGTARGDPHRLVVVALAAARGEGVAEPEAARQSDRVGDVGEGRRALVGGDDEIGIVAVSDDDALGMDDPVADDIVGDREQGADEDAIGFGAFRHPGVAIRRRRQLLGIEAALGAGRHDHRVLDHLRLHQPEYLGAEIIAPVGP